MVTCTGAFSRSTVVGFGRDFRQNLNRCDRDRFARQFLADGAAEESIPVENPDLGHIAWIIPQEHLFANRPALD